MFANNYPYLSDQVKKALFGILYRLQSVISIPPKVMLKLFNTVVKPILIYSTDVWDHNKSSTSMADKVMLRFCRCVLSVKVTTSNTMVYGECEILPPSIYCNVSALCYIDRLHHMPEDSIVKHVYNELAELHQLGFMTWVTDVSELVNTYSLDIDRSPAEFKSEWKRTVTNRFINIWTEQVQNIHINRIRRTYCNIKYNFGIETYLDAIMIYKYRVAMSQQFEYPGNWIRKIHSP